MLHFIILLFIINVHIMLQGTNNLSLDILFPVDMFESCAGAEVRGLCTIAALLYAVRLCIWNNCGPDPGCYVRGGRFREICQWYWFR